MGFEWYENGRLIGENKQYYSAGRSSTDLLDGNAVYMVKLVDEDGNNYQTCPTKIDLATASHFLVYPNFVQAGETVNVETQTDPKQLSDKSELNVINLNGSLVYNQIMEGNRTSFEMETPGIYVVQLISGASSQTAKLLITK